MNQNAVPSANRPKRWPRRLLWIALSGVVFIALAAVLLVPRLLDIESYRAGLEAAIGDATGWKAELGEMDFSVVRGMALTVSPLRLSAPGDSSRIDIARVKLHAELMPLLKGRLHVRDIALAGSEFRVVRASEEQGWIVPVPPAGAQPPAADERGGGLDVAIDRIEAADGLLVIEDRGADPPRILELSDFDMTMLPASGEIFGGCALPDGGGRARVKGSLEQGFDVDLEDVTTQVLRGFVGEELMREGGLLAGKIRVDFPLRIGGQLSAERLTLLSGEQPFDDAKLTFEVRTEGERWWLESLEFRGDGLRMSGRGELLPAVDLELRLPSTGLATVLQASQSALPLPLDLTPPGDVQAEILVDMPPGGQLSFEAHGTLSAALFNLAETLPPVRDVRAAFDLDRAGALVIRVLEGNVAGGPLTGTARIDPIYPPGELVFDGGIQEAALGSLLGGMVAQADGRVSGPTGITAKMGLDLSRPEIDARALTGRLDLSSRDVSMPGWDLDGAIYSKIEEKLGSLSGIGAVLDEKLRARREREAGAPDDANLVEQLLDGMQASVNFDSWPWKLEQMAIAAEGFGSSGSGTFDPVAGTVDLGFTSRFNKTRTAELTARYSQLGVLVDDQGRLTLPLRIEGALLSPSIKVDLGAALEQRLGTGDPKEAVKDLLKGILDKRKN